MVDDSPEVSEVPVSSRFEPLQYYWSTLRGEVLLKVVGVVVKVLVPLPAVVLLDAGVVPNAMWLSWIPEPSL